MIHSQHLHRIVALGQNIILNQYIQACMEEGNSVSFDIIDSDTKDKLRAVFLLKTILCTRASDVMVYHASWNQVVQNILQILSVLYSVIQNFCIHE